MTSKQKHVYLVHCNWCKAEIYRLGEIYYSVQVRTKGKSKLVDILTMCERCYIKFVPDPKKKQKDYIIQNEEGHSSGGDAGLPESPVHDSEVGDGVRSDRDSLREQVRPHD